jgi:hypothetical protein
MKFTQATLNQVAGFDAQILAEQLVFTQKSFWNIAYSAQNANTYQSVPSDLTGATISAEIIRRVITDFSDSRTGLNFKIFDYPLVADILSVKATTAIDNTIYCSNRESKLLFIGQPIAFRPDDTTDLMFGGLVEGVTYYVIALPTSDTFQISDTSGGAALTLTDGTGLMWAGRVSPTVITLPIINRNDVNGTFTLTMDDSTWDIIAGDPDLDIAAPEPICFTGRIKTSYPASGTQPAYDEIVFLLFLVYTDGVVN